MSSCEERKLGRISAETYKKKVVLLVNKLLFTHIVFF